MKIGILIPELTLYGAERVALRLARGLHAAGMVVTVLLTDKPVSAEIVRATNVENIAIKSMLQGETLSLSKKLLYAPLQYLWLYHRIKREKIDILVSLMERANIFNVTLPGNFRRIPSIHSFLGRDLQEKPSLVHKLAPMLFYRLFRNRPDFWVCVSKGVSADFGKRFHIDPHKIITIYNPLDIDMITSLAQEKLEEEHRDLLNGNSILHVGRFTKDKGQYHLIRAFSKIQKALPDSKLILLGEGELLHAAETLADDLGLREKVHFLGFQANPFKFMSRALVLAFPSIWEGFGITLIEALCCKAAIVSADCKSGPREILSPGTDFNLVAQTIEKAEYGILVPPFDGKFREADAPLTREESILAEALLMLLQDSSLRQGYKDCGLARVEEFRADRVIKKWIDVFRHLHSQEC